MDKKTTLLLLSAALLPVVAVVWYQQKQHTHVAHEKTATEPQFEQQLVQDQPSPEPVVPEQNQKTDTPIKEMPNTPESSEHQQSVSRTIAVTNKITDKMLYYKKGFMQYLPEFSITVNGISLEQGQEKPIEIPNGVLKVTYSYNFANGYKTGMKSVLFNVPEDLKELAITFNWKNDWRVVVDGATPFEVIVLAEK